MCDTKHGAVTLANPSKLSIANWAEEDRPREKLARLGAQALSNAELLAILIGSGSAKESAVELMKRVLADCNNNLNTLGKRTIHELTQYNGMGPAKAITILAACELGKRRQLEKAEERPDLGSATAIYNHLHPLMQDLDTEEAWILLMNQNFRLIKRERISHGGISETAVDVRVIMREALLNNATVLALAHNHPSQNTRPSKDDDALTERVRITASLGHTDRRPGMRWLRLNDVAASSEHALTITTHEAGDEVIAFIDALSLDVTLDGNAFLSAGADVRGRVGGQAQPAAQDAEPMTQEAVEALAGKLYRRLDDDVKATIQEGL